MRAMFIAASCSVISPFWICPMYLVIRIIVNKKGFSTTKIIIIEETGLYYYYSFLYRLEDCSQIFEKILTVRSNIVHSSPPSLTDMLADHFGKGSSVPTGTLFRKSVYILAVINFCRDGLVLVNLDRERIFSRPIVTVIFGRHLADYIENINDKIHFYVCHNL